MPLSSTVPDFRQLTIQRACIHLVLKKETGATHSDVEYDETPVTLSDEVHDIITRRLVTYCGERSRSFELLIAQGLPISFFGQAHTMRQANNEEFIEKTKAIAFLLAKSQTSSRPPSSCLVVLDAVAEDGLPVVICIKAELTEALTQEIVEGVSHLKKVEKLFMGRSEKFFKLGIIYKLSAAAIHERELAKENGEELLPQEEWGAILYDHQFRSSTRPAEYFWKDFLGFSIDGNDKVKLKKFYTETVAFIEKKIIDLDERSEALARLDDYVVNTNVEQIDPAQVMNTIIPEDKRDAFDSSIREEFARPFARDASLVEKKILRSRMEFPNKLVLSGTKESFSAVQVIDTQADLSKLKVEPGFTIIRIQGKPDRLPGLKFIS